MPAPKGHPRWGGSKKGSKQIKTRAWEAIGQTVINDWADRYVEEVSLLPAKEFMDRFENILEYFKPKLLRSDNTNEHTFKGSGLKIGYGDKGTE